MATRTCTFFGASKVLALSVLAGCTGSIGTAGPPEKGTTTSSADPSHPSTSVGSVAGDATSVDLEQDLHCDTPKVGSAPLRRLTSDEYINTVRDLLGVMVSPDTLPADEQVGPFHGNVVSPIIDLYAQQYIDNAETLALAAVSNLSKLVPCDPVKAGNVDCASRFIDSFGLKTSRRPLTADEKQRYLTLYNTYAASQGFANGIRLVITAMLQAPHFLYHVEFESPKSGPLAPLGGYEMASRLAYFLWSSTPDDTLFAEASKSALTDPATLRAQANRMLADPRAESTIRNFHLA